MLGGSSGINRLQRGKWASVANNCRGVDLTMAWWKTTSDALLRSVLPITTSTAIRNGRNMTGSFEKVTASDTVTWLHEHKMTKSPGSWQSISSTPHTSCLQLGRSPAAQPACAKITFGRFLLGLRLAVYPKRLGCTACCQFYTEDLRHQALGAADPIAYLAIKVTAYRPACEQLWQGLQSFTSTVFAMSISPIAQVAGALKDQRPGIRTTYCDSDRDHVKWGVRTSLPAEGRDMYTGNTRVNFIVQPPGYRLSRDTPALGLDGRYSADARLELAGYAAGAAGRALSATRRRKPGQQPGVRAGARRGMSAVHLFNYGGPCIWNPEFYESVMRNADKVSPWNESGSLRQRPARAAREITARCFRGSTMVATSSQPLLCAEPHPYAGRPGRVDRQNNDWSFYDVENDPE